MPAQIGWIWECNWHNALKPPVMSGSLFLCAEKGTPDLDSTLSAGEQDLLAGTGLVEGEDGKKPPFNIRCCTLSALCSLSRFSRCTVSSHRQNFSNSERTAQILEGFKFKSSFTNVIGSCLLFSGKGCTQGKSVSPAPQHLGLVNMDSKVLTMARYIQNVLKV